MTTLISLRSFAVAFSLSLGLAAVGCSVEPATESAEEAITTPSIVGKYQFVWEGERKAAVYAQLAEKLSGPELEAAKREADAEAAASHLEFGADGVFHSFIGDEEIGTWSYELEPVDATTATLTKRGGESVTVRFQNDDIIIHDPKKGPLTFRRVRQ